MVETPTRVDCSEICKILFTNKRLSIKFKIETTSETKNLSFANPFYEKICKFFDSFESRCACEFENQRQDEVEKLRNEMVQGIFLK